MNSKNIKRHLGNKLRDWMESIEDENVKAVVKENTIITGGALVSLLTGETVHISKATIWKSCVHHCRLEIT